MCEGTLPTQCLVSFQLILKGFRLVGIHALSYVGVYTFLPFGIVFHVIHKQINVEVGSIN